MRSFPEGLHFSALVTELVSQFLKYIMYVAYPTATDSTVAHTVMFYETRNRRNRIKLSPIDSHDPRKDNMP